LCGTSIRLRGLIFRGKYSPDGFAGMSDDGVRSGLQGSFFFFPFFFLMWSALRAKSDIPRGDGVVWVLLQEDLVFFTSAIGLFLPQTSPVAQRRRPTVCPGGNLRRRLCPADSDKFLAKKSSLRKHPLLRPIPPAASLSERFRTSVIYPPCAFVHDSL